MRIVFIVTILFTLAFSSCTLKEKATDNEKNEVSIIEREEVESEMEPLEFERLAQEIPQAYREELLLNYFTENPIRSFEKSDENIESTMPGQPFYTSPLRIEELTVKTPYTDDVEYLSHNDNGDYWYITVKNKNGTASLIYSADISSFNAGDILTIEWEMDSYWVAGDGESEWIGEWVTDIRLKEKGNLSKFIDKGNNQNVAIKIVEQEPSEWIIDEISPFIYNYLANEEKYSLAIDAGEKLIVEVSRFESDLRIENMEGNLYFYVDIIKGDNLTDIATLFISRNYADDEAIYEYDKIKNKLNKFSTN